MNTKSRPRRRPPISTAIAVIAGLVAAAGCSSSDDTAATTTVAPTTVSAGSVDSATTVVAPDPTDVTSSSASTPTSVATTDSVDDAITTTVADPWADNKATGTPITLGFIWDGATESADTTIFLSTYRAVMEYANDHLGGLNGHPIELLECSNDGLPAKAAECATQMIQAKVPAVLSQGGAVQDSWEIPILEAGIPVITAQTLTEAGANMPGGFVISNALFGNFGGPAVLAKQAGAKQAAIFVIDVPSAVQTLETLAPAFWEQAGIQFNVVKIPGDQADVAPAVQAELAQNNPGFVSILGTPQVCLRVGKALQDAGYEGGISINAGCAIPDVAAGMNLEGVFGTGSVGNLPSSPEVQLVLKIIETYAPAGTEKDDPKPSFQGAMGFIRAMATLEGDITPENIKATLAAMPPAPLPLVDGATFQCNGQAVPGAKNVCSSSAVADVYDKDGQVVDEFPLNASDLG